MVGPVIFDAVKRYLAYNGYDVTWVVNITDVDDKLIVESAKRGVTMQALAEEMTADYMNNLQAMGVDTIDHFPKATDNIKEIIELIETLIARGYAYPSEGDVLFDCVKDKEYGKLTGRTVDSIQGDGGEAASKKRSLADFALWKAAKPGEPSWDSPWGKGRPGWHIECSAMSRRLLGETFDIHGGGLDLVFPHHENEIAQSECAHGKPQAKYWMHNGLMQAADQVGKLGGRATREAEAGDLASQEAGKISKSKGAGPFRDLLKEVKPEAIRFLLLSTHYRSPIFFSIDELRKCEGHLDKFAQYFKRYERVTGQSFYDITPPKKRGDGEIAAPGDTLLTEVAELRSRFLASMDDDFNTGGAIGVLFDLLRLLNRHVETEKLETVASDAAKQSLGQATRTLRELTSVLGLFRAAPVEAADAGADNQLTGQLMQLLIDLRAESRKKKDFATADTIRNRLTEIGITLEDRPGGTEWTKG
jgi:cysteinyl-tRNA synthetase